MKARRFEDVASVGQFRELLNYDAKSGDFLWMESGQRKRKGAVAGHTERDGYIRIGAFKRLWLAHRLAWFMHHGTDPGDLFVDHIDGDRSNNAIANLRLADASQNSANKVVRYRRRKLPQHIYLEGSKFAYIFDHHGKRYAKYCFASPEEALDACWKMRREVIGEFADLPVATHNRERPGYEVSEGAAHATRGIYTVDPKPFRVALKSNGVLHHVGSFATLAEAQRARDEAEAKLLANTAEQGSTTMPEMAVGPSGPKRADTLSND